LAFAPRARLPIGKILRMSLALVVEDISSIQMQNGVAAAGPGSSPTRETPLSFRHATAIGRAALNALIGIRTDGALASFMPWHALAR
jgi:hypothetical protein